METYPDSFSSSFLRGFQNNVDHKTRRSVHRGMVNLVGPDCCAHPVRHEALRLMENHPIFFGDEVPGGLCLPCRGGNLFLYTLHCEWPLHRSHDRELVWRGLVRYG